MPEERNRVIIDHIAKVRMCPNAASQLNLLKEGITENVFVTGDPSFDSLGSVLPTKTAKNKGKYVLLTLHRDFNADDVVYLKVLMAALEEYGQPVLFPIHPRTQRTIHKNKIKIPKNVTDTAPVSYKKFVNLVANAKKVVTDSGGVQREAFWLGVPVIILRDETEWREIVSLGAGVLARPDTLLHELSNFRGKIIAPPVFGAKDKIKDILYRYA